jgi:hypothetical protein
MVVYYNKGKTTEKKRVARSAAKPTSIPTTTQTLFDYVGGYNNWNFKFTDKHPIQMDWTKPQPPLPSADAAATQGGQATPLADQASNQAAPAQTNYAAPAPAQTNYAAPAQAAPAQAQADAQPAAYPATQTAFQPQTAYPEQNTAAAPAATATGAQASNDVTTIKVPNSALEQGKIIDWLE